MKYAFNHLHLCVACLKLLNEHEFQRPLLTAAPKVLSTAVPTVSFVDPSSSRGILGYVSVMATFKFTYVLIKGLMFCYK